MQEYNSKNTTGGNPPQSETSMSAIDVCLIDLNAQINRLKETNYVSYHIAEKLFPEQVSDVKENTPEEDPRGIIGKFRKLIDSFTAINARLEANLLRISEITGK